MNENPLISVIVPVYNVEKYLKRCVESILNQTHSNIQVLLVDDGSTDQSGEICDWYAEKDQRIRVLHQKNAGQSAARNNALRKVKGEYIAFIDSDDFWETDMLSYLLGILKKNDAQLSVCGVHHIGFPNQQEESNNNQENIFVCEGQDIARNILLGTNGFSGSASHMLIDAKICQNQFYMEGHIYEDMEYMVRLALIEKKAVASQLRKYNYCYRSDNSSSTPSKKRKEDLDAVVQQLEQLVQAETPELMVCVDNRYISNAIYILRTLHRGEEDLFYWIRTDILRRKIDKDVQPTSIFLLYQALKFGRFSFKTMNLLYNGFRKMRCQFKPAEKKND